jgi:hypothetical protein
LVDWLSLPGAPSIVNNRYYRQARISELHLLYVM